MESYSWPPCTYWLGTLVIKWAVFAWVLSNLEIDSLHISFLIGKMGIMEVSLWRYRNYNGDDVTTEKCPTWFSA